MQNPSTSLGAFEKRDVTPRNKHCPFGLGKKIHLENHGEKDLNKAVLGNVRNVLRCFNSFKR